MNMWKDKAISFGEKSSEYPFGYGYCQCGCGKTAPVLSSTVKVIKRNGQSIFYKTYLKYRAAHRVKIAIPAYKIGVIIKGYEKGYGYCQCGCGEETRIGRIKSDSGKKTGSLRNRYIAEHYSKTEESRKRQSILATRQLGKRDYSWISSYGRSKTGVYFSKKLGYEIGYMSSYEKSAFEILDNDEKVERYEPQPFCIEYKYGDGMRTYTPDLSVDYIDGKRVIVEVKPESMKGTTKNRAKFEAIEKFCIVKGFKFEIWDENI